MKFYENGDALTDPVGFFCSGIHCDVKGVRNGIEIDTDLIGKIHIAGSGAGQE